MKKASNIVLLPRVGYFDFMKLLNNSAFVITDGGSNQEELFYMRKPCLILRTVTERKEGLGINARLIDGTAIDIKRFINENIVNISDEKLNIVKNPSDIIVDCLMYSK